MPIEFIARVAGVDDEYCLVAAVAEHENGTGRALMFQAALEDPDEQDVLLQMDTHCLVTEDQGTAYGCVRELTIDGDRMHVSLAQEALADLGLDDAVVEVQLAVDRQSVEVLREYLGRILRYGRPDARPAVLRL
ncbi:Imm10 family immunity protein [Actinoplanes subtropicus]|uniref:Imm10 family immunity protein n=1 Tax=Actinoplanes subtropicus TaxID=543632 RepID=UPI0004C429A8|nr:Imm10 family immunity protein [Actinoplanes subtropicus]